MEVFIVISIIVLLILALASSRNKTNKKSFHQIQPANQKSLPMTNEEKLTFESEELTKTLLKSIKITIGTSTTNLYDDSVIDISDSGYKIPEVQTANNSDVPYWAHFYIYSYQDLAKANTQQKAFYQQFKASFLKGQYLDIKGNTNYAFILLFDLLQESDRQPDLKMLEEQLSALADNYPRTATYCRSFLAEKMQKRGDYEGIARINEMYRYRYPTSGYEFSDYNLGTKYKAKLKLTDEQVKLLNKIYYPNNNFCSIEFCLVQTIRLFLLLIEEYNDLLANQGSTLSKELEEVAGVVATNEFKYRRNSSNFKYAIDSFSADLYRLLFKYSENALREHYGHKRKINMDFQYTGETKKQLQEKVLDRLPEVMVTILPKIEGPDEAAEWALNEQNTSRWKTAFEKIKTDFGANSTALLSAIHQLAKANKKNPSIENIYLEASKWMAKMDREASVSFYVYYLFYDLKSATFDNRPLTKTIQKSLFKTADELQAFEQIITNLIKDRDLEKALQGIPKVFGPKRKKIKLDTAAITEVHQKHCSTVNLLDDILNDDEELEHTDPPAENKDEELKIEIIQTGAQSTIQSEIANPLHLTQVQLELLEVFAKQSWLVTGEEMDAFAKSKGVFKNGLIESLNEACYECLDDVLIEEEEENFIINEQYFQKITAA
jgi:hypothetical protein